MHCPRRHSFDIAKQGYVSLLDGRSGALSSDTADMVAARLRVHDAGVLDPVVIAVAAAAGHPTETRSVHSSAPSIIDLGSGPGHYLDAALGGVDGARGVGLDLSKYCARALTRRVARAGAIVADVWRDLPLADNSADVVLSVFAPRNVDETARILAPGGRWVIVTPQPDHLGELIEPMAMLSVAADKTDAVSTAVARRFDIIEHTPIRESRRVSASTIADLVAMGPTAFHRSPDEIERAAQAFAPGSATVPVTVAVTVTVCQASVDR
ncbi:putative rRNA methyltransferase [Gordonia aichiensis NBRC 108223]|uniref:Putative rRNA methyltransferase n=1 Tax=Gordonia aichiensis NBRC 108223 TaxID=1220583 RepID=L7KFE2_9ACTN|nr:methyltransferase domain-containing protein [Gordonia aichiensis]GAC47590.1 putative rRNA methyltransferase [Gordonia aichiensis NBRC 108223]